MVTEAVRHKSPSGWRVKTGQRPAEIGAARRKALRKNFHRLEHLSQRLLKDVEPFFVVH